MAQEYAMSAEDVFPLPRHLVNQNQIALAKREELALWGQPFGEALLEQDQAKHAYPFFGNVKCRVATEDEDYEFVLFSANDDVVAWIYFWLDSYEPAVMGRWMNLAARSKRVLDVGAYTGCYSLAAALTGAQVDAFEMVPRTVERLKVNVYLNGLRRSVEIHPVGVSDRAASVEISMPRQADFLGTGNSVQPKERVAAVDTTTCRVIKLDDWWSEAGKPKIDLIKLDVEEHEVEALHGTVGLLAQARPTLIVEIERSNLPEVRQICHDLSYELEKLEGINYLMTPE